MISKTYAPSGTSWPLIRARPDLRSNSKLIHRKTPGWERMEIVTGNKRNWSTLMWDVVMLALGLGFFAAGIGYAYACERL
jgi:hypothetical protein